MTFWTLDGSSTWQEDDLSNELHDALFKVKESTQVNRNQKKKKKKRKVETQTAEDLAPSPDDRGTQQEDKSLSQNIKSSKKQKKKRNLGEMGASEKVSKRDKASPGSKESFPSTTNQDLWSVKDGEIITLLKEPSTITKNTETSLKQNTHEKTPEQKQVKKKRKRKARKNKFRVESEQVGKSDCGDEEKFKASEVQPQNGLHSEANNASTDSNPSLSRKERRKLKRKLAKQHLQDQNPESGTPSKKMKRTSDELEVKPPSQHEEKVVNKDEDSKSNEVESDSGGGLILVKSKKSLNLKSSLKTEMESQLKSSQFRLLNEHLYKVTGKEAKQLFAGDKAAFVTYHEGFTQQVEQWPVNPVDVIIEVLKRRPASQVVGDFGCGDAKIARSVRQKVHSFDLYPINKHVTVCNIAKVPLKPSTLDVAIFCLSLMGTDWIDFVMEANRTLKQGGLLKVAEVASRFTSLASFLSVMKTLGFHLKSKDLSNKVFYLFDFKKRHAPTSAPLPKGVILKPCLYKKR
ncbi:uncharacterized protein [Diadema antillarum]|uniref:uncharacterized protein n=1 Tax=Diadema antillarum TaxID=105358 RepID=UPI003A83D3C1